MLKCRQNYIWIGLIFCHLSLVSFGAAGVDYSKFGWIGAVLDYYGMISGANEQYGFFAPGVGSQLGVFFDLVGENGEIKTVRLEAGKSHEAALRIGNIFRQFQNESFSDPKKLQRAVAASFAGTLFGRYPGTKKIVVRLEEFDPVSMQEYREGIRPQWAPIYQAQFIHDKK